MSKKNRDSSTLFELISQAGGRIKGVRPPKRRESPQAPADQTPPAEPAAPPEPEPAPLAEPADLPEQSAPAAPPEQKAEQPAGAPAQIEAQVPSAAKPKAKKASSKRPAKAPAKAPAGAGGQAKAKKRTPAAAGAGASAPKPAKDHEPPVQEPTAVQPSPPAQDTPRPMPAGLVPPAYLRPKAQAGPRPAVSQSVTPVPPLPLIAGAVAIVLMIVTFVIGFIAGRASAPRSAAGPDGQGSLAPMDTHRPDGGQPGPSGRIDGMHYLIIQELAGSTAKDRTDAFDIQTFCESKGYPADVRRYTREDGGIAYAVVSFKPLESPVSPEAKAFAMEIEELGRKYEAQGGNYRFQQRPSRTAELRPRYELWREPPQE